MSRPLRIEFPGAIYHVTSRGDRREPIFDDDQDREVFLDVLGTALDRFNACALAYCLMGNHYHLVSRPTVRNTSATPIPRNATGSGLAFCLSRASICPDEG